jgi:hypothetical protein
MHFILVLSFALLQSGTPQLNEILPSRAETLAVDLTADLDASGILKEHGIKAFAFPGAIGDVQGAFHDRLLTHMLRDLGLERIAEREERVQILQDYFRKDGFEEGIYNGSSLKSLGGQFLDNEAILGARIYTVDGSEGLEIYAQAELWDARRAVMVWNKTISLVVAPATSPPVVVNVAMEDEKSWLVPGLIVLAGVAIASYLLMTMRRREQIAKATRRGGAALEKRAQKKRDADLLGEAARRLHSVADHLTKSAGKVGASTRKGLESLAESLRSLARDFEKSPAGSFRRPVEGRGDAGITAARTLADHDERTLGLVEEIERSVEALLSGVSTEVTELAAQQVAKVDDLVQSTSRRLGERADLIRSSS